VLVKEGFTRPAVYVRRHCLREAAYRCRRSSGDAAWCADRQAAWIAEHGESAHSARADYRGAADCGRRVGTASDAAVAMELGFDAVLMNTAIAAAKDPLLMARGDAACGSGRTPGVSFAGRMQRKLTPRPVLRLKGFLDRLLLRRQADSILIVGRHSKMQ